MSLNCSRMTLFVCADIVAARATRSIHQYRRAGCHRSWSGITASRLAATPGNRPAASATAAFMPREQRAAVYPVRLVLGVSGRGGLEVERLAQPRHDLRESGRVVPGSAPVARTRADDELERRLHLGPDGVCGAQKSGDVKMARNTARMSPSVFCHVATAASTQPSGGSSATKRAHSLR